MNCPQCGGADVRLSRQPGALDVFYRIWGREAYRCRNCRRRFYGAKFAPKDIAAPHRRVTPFQWSRWPRGSRQRKRLVRSVVVLAIFGVAFVIFWLFLRFITTE